MSEHAGQDNGMLRVTIREAANRLGVTEAAIRKRIQRGSLDKEPGSDGRVYVYLDLSQYMSGPESQVHHEPLVEELRERVRFLEDQVRQANERDRENRRIIAALTQRIPELEAPSELPGGPETVAEESEGAGPRSSTGGPQTGPDRARDTAEFPVGGSLSRPWWRRVFGG